MKVKKLVYPVVILSCFLLVGCANSTRVTELSSDMNKLNIKIDQVENDIHVLKPEIENIKNEVTRANKRLDNQSFFYRK